MSPTATLAEARRRQPEVFAAGRRHGRVQLVVGLTLLAYLAFAAWFFGITPARLFGGLGRLGPVIGRMLVWQDMASWDYRGIAEGLAQSLAMAFLGTVLASLISLPLGFLAAINVVRPRLPRHLARRLADFLRGIDALVWALVYVRAVGLGPLAGLLAIITRDIGEFTKLFSEAIETADPKPSEGVRATGAGRLQELRFGTLPQVLPLLVSQILYQFESNVRNATILGVVGAGGIGLQLSERIKVQIWDQAAFIILLILLTVAAIDAISRRLRQAIIGDSRR